VPRYVNVKGSSREKVPWLTENLLSPDLMVLRTLREEKVVRPMYALRTYSSKDSCGLLDPTLRIVQVRVLGWHDAFGILISLRKKKKVSCMMGGGVRLMNEEKL
jgi:hypothetical protein